MTHPFLFRTGGLFFPTFPSFFLCPLYWKGVAPTVRGRGICFHIPSLSRIPIISLCPLRPEGILLCWTKGKGPNEVRIGICFRVTSLIRIPIVETPTGRGLIYIDQKIFCRDVTCYVSFTRYVSCPRPRFVKKIPNGWPSGINKKRSLSNIHFL